MSFRKSLFVCLMLYPWHCFAVDPEPPSVFNIENPGSLVQMTSALKENRQIRTMTVKCDTFEWQWSDLWGLLWKIVPKLKKTLGRSSLTAVHANIKIHTKDVCADGIASYLVALLEQIPCLEHLYVSGMFSEKSMPVLAKYIKSTQKLKSIDIGFSLAADGPSQLLDAIQGKDLFHLGIDIRGWGEQDVQRFFNILKTYKSLQSLTVSSDDWARSHGMRTYVTEKPDQFKRAVISGTRLCTHLENKVFQYIYGGNCEECQKQYASVF